MEHTAAAEYYNAYVHWNLMHYNALKLIVVLNSHPKISPVSYGDFVKVAFAINHD